MKEERWRRKRERKGKEKNRKRGMKFGELVLGAGSNEREGRRGWQMVTMDTR